MNNALPLLNVVKNEKILSKTGLFSENFLSVYYQGQQSTHQTCVSSLTIQWYHSRSQSCFLSYMDISVAVPIGLVPWALTLQTWLKHIWTPFQVSFLVRSKEPRDRYTQIFHRYSIWTWMGHVARPRNLKTLSDLAVWTQPRWPAFVCKDL